MTNRDETCHRLYAEMPNSKQPPEDERGLLCDGGLDGFGVEAHRLRGGVAQHGVGGREALERLAEVVGRRRCGCRHRGEDGTDRHRGGQGSHPHLLLPCCVPVRRPGRGR